MFWLLRKHSIVISRTYGTKNLLLLQFPSNFFEQELEDHDWLDVNSRAVFLEFTVYNANVNLFGSVIMLIEFMSTGGAVTRAEVKVRCNQ